MNPCITDISLVYVVMASDIVKAQLPVPGLVPSPRFLKFSKLSPDIDCLFLISEVSLQIQLQQKIDLLLREVRDVHILMHAKRNRAREPQFDRPLGSSGHLSTASIFVGRC